ncbi:hypothetical protein FOA52_002650 [Chlamydomonas sp. UWO 241]|nr:hypothetical protein FOA52_002650 [Chlamydomonas sp. UWO 241]
MELEALRAAEAAAAVARRGAMPKDGVFSHAEIAQHRTPNDAWLIIDGKVYDVTAWDHPGGDVLLSYAGLDATEVFHAMHKTAAPKAYMRSLLVGTLGASSAGSVTSESGARDTMLEEFATLKTELSNAGLMRANRVYYFRKVMELVAMGGAGLYLLLAGHAAASSAAWGAAMLLLGVCIAQSGWLGHDFAHLQVFESNKSNNLVSTFILAIGMGGSCHWWKNKHNRHHATPNRLDSDTQAPIDPDIDTIPLLAWSDELAMQVDPRSRAIIGIQHYLLWPLLTVAYANWVQQSTIHMLFFPTITAKQRTLECTLVAIHHIGLATAVFTSLPLASATMMFMFLHGVAGFILAFVFVQSHNGMEVYADDKDFVTAQLVSTRNIDPGLVTDWFFGGLNYQIEHHLIPTLPRHSLSAVRPMVAAFAAKHGLVYESCGLYESSGKVYNRLKHVARLAHIKSA